MDTRYSRNIVKFKAKKFAPLSHGELPSVRGSGVLRMTERRAFRDALHRFIRPRHREQTEIIAFFGRDNCHLAGIIIRDFGDVQFIARFIELKVVVIARGLFQRRSGGRALEGHEASNK